MCPVSVSCTQGSIPDVPSSASKKSHLSDIGTSPENTPGEEPDDPGNRSTTISAEPVDGS